VFAPKYIFDSLRLLVVDISLFIVLIKILTFFKDLRESLRNLIPSNR
jgi:hypothetical protein